MLTSLVHRQNAMQWQMQKGRRLVSFYFLSVPETREEFFDPESDMVFDLLVIWLFIL
jgi:hypothetical protein